MVYAVEPAAKVFRGKDIEAIHYASIAVVDGDGKLSHYLGDPTMASMTRSCIKPFQLIPLLSTGAADQFEFTPKQLAIMCGSHTGSDEHKKVVESNLKRAGCGADDLQCGCHWPLGMQIDNEYPRHGEDKDPVRHNCSGKHSGFLALARFLEVDRADYLNPDSRSQRMVLAAVSGFCEYPVDLMSVGVDGCSAPNFPVGLTNLALGFKKLASIEGADSDATDVLSRIRQAMTEYPEMVSGEKRFDLDLARSFPDNVVCKIGAESIEGIGFSRPRIGIGVKVHDGNSRALGPICVALLKKLGLIGDIEDFPLLKKYEEPEVLNVRRIVTGFVKSDFALRKV